MKASYNAKQNQMTLDMSRWEFEHVWVFYPKIWWAWFCALGRETFLWRIVIAASLAWDMVKWSLRNDLNHMPVWVKYFMVMTAIFGVLSIIDPSKTIMRFLSILGGITISWSITFLWRKFMSDYNPKGHYPWLRRFLLAMAAVVVAALIAVGLAGIFIILKFLGIVP